jgi:formylglycine-generating enzyme required for sulfatase activity
MARIEKTVFISYRRTDAFTALAVYENLKNEGYDVFIDYRSISSGDFEQIITDNIRARAHFLLILTPTALDKCDEAGDWLRREIEVAIDEKRNIVPLFFRGFRFGDPSLIDKLTGKLNNLSRYNGLNVHEDYFDEAMQRLCTQYLSQPLDTYLHPVSNVARNVAREEQMAADKALEQIGNIQDLVKGESKRPKTESTSKQEVSSRFNFRLLGGVLVGLLILGSLLLSISNIWLTSATQERTPTTPTDVPFKAQANVTEPEQTAEPLLAQTSDVATPTLHVGSTMAGEDGMTLLFIPAGEFLMGSKGNSYDERPMHTVYLDEYFIDQTEVSNAMYAVCVESGNCEPPRDNTSLTRHAGSSSFYYGNTEFDNYPVIYVSWNDAKAYCTFVNRRLPTEAEWEKAASWDDTKETKRIYPWGDSIDCSYANFYGGDNKTLCVGDTSAVGSYVNGASFYGVLDMAGNVWEWVLDRYDSEYYGKSPDADPQGPRSGDYIVIRGGSFLIGMDNGIRSADREKLPPDNTSHNVGFRCAMDATP